MADEDKTRLERAEESDRWNSNTLHDHLTGMLLELEKRMDQRFTAQETATSAALAAAEKAVGAALVAAEKAVLKAESLASQRAAQQNEWRQTVTDLTGLMMPRKEYEAAHQGVQAQVTALTTRMDVSAGQQRGASVTVAYVLAAGAGLVSIGSLIIAFMAR